MSTTLTLTTARTPGALRGEASPARERADALAALLGTDTVPDTITIDGVPFEWCDTQRDLLERRGDTWVFTDTPTCTHVFTADDTDDDADQLTVVTDGAGTVVTVTAEFGLFFVTRTLEGVDR